MTNNNEDKGRQALLDFWAEHRLLKVEQALREFLGTETLADLDDVYPYDLRTLRACQWAEARLTVAEANRLAHAVKVHHAAKHAHPEPGVEHLPRCRACSCQNEGDALDAPMLLRRSTGYDMSSAGFDQVRESGI